MSTETPVKPPSIFISHSSKDIHVARAVRNLFEDMGHHVLLLGLLQNMTDDEIYLLLDDEVKARDWLLLVDSSNAQNSKWVHFEVEKAESYKKTLYKIKADRFLASERYLIETEIRPCIEKFSYSIRTLIAYTNEDIALAQKIHDHLVANRYECVMGLKDLKLGTDWRSIIQQAIEAVRNWGVLISVISQASIANQRSIPNIEIPRHLEGRILPILIEPVDELPRALQHIPYLDVSQTGLESPEALTQITARLDQMRHQLLEKACY